MQPPTGPAATLTRQKSDGVICVINDGTLFPILYAHRRENYHCSVALPFRGSVAHVIISIAKAGKLTQQGEIMIFAREEAVANSVDRFVSMCQTSTHGRQGTMGLAISPVPNSHPASSRLTLSFGIRDLQCGSHHSHGQVLRITFTFVVFVPPPANAGRKINVVTSFLLRLSDGRKKPSDVNATPFPALRLPTTLYERSFAGGGRNVPLELQAIDEIPVMYAELAKLEQEQFESDPEGFVTAIRRLANRSIPVENEEQEGELDPEDEEFSRLLSRFPANYGRCLLSMSYLHSDSQSLWPVPVVVSSPKGNFTMGTTESGRVIPMIRSTNVCSVTPLDDGTERSLFVDRSDRNQSGQNGYAESRMLSSAVLDGDPSTLEQRERDFITKKRDGSADQRTSYQWTLKEIVGVGGFGIVFAAVCSTDAFGGPFVCKTSRPEAGVYGREMLLHEGKVLVEQSQLRDSFLLNGRLHLVMKRFELWSEQEFVVNPLHPIEKLYALKQLIHRIHIVHESGFAHCDLKPDNLLVWQNAYAVDCAVWACDFGFAVDWREGQKARGGTVGYMPPSLDGDPRKIDVYSFGIIAWELWTGKRAFQRERDQFLRRKNASDESNEYPQDCALQFLAAIRGKTPDLNCPECVSMPEEMRVLLTGCWAEDSEERPGMKEIDEEFKEFYVVALRDSLVSGDVQSRNFRGGIVLSHSERPVCCVCWYADSDSVALLSALLDCGQLQLVMGLFSKLEHQKLSLLIMMSRFGREGGEETLVDSVRIVQDRLEEYRQLSTSEKPRWFPVPSDVSQALHEAAEALRSGFLTPIDAFSVGMLVCAFSLVEYAQENHSDLIRDLLERSEILCQKGDVPMRWESLLLKWDLFPVFSSLSKIPLRCVWKWGAFLCQMKNEDEIDSEETRVMLAFFKRLFDAQCMNYKKIASHS